MIEDCTDCLDYFFLFCRFKFLLMLKHSLPFMGLTNMHSHVELLSTNPAGARVCLLVASLLLCWSG